MINYENLTRTIYNTQEFRMNIAIHEL